MTFPPFPSPRDVVLPREVTAVCALRRFGDAKESLETLACFVEVPTTYWSCGGRLHPHVVYQPVDTADVVDC